VIRKVDIMKLEFVTIIDCIQFAVDKITNEVSIGDSHKPKFIVSLYEKCDSKGKIIEHEILLTIKHLNHTKSRTIFPRLDYDCGYETIKDEMIWLYNSTL